MKNPYNILAENPTGKKPLGKLWRRWEITINMDLKQISWIGLMWLMMVSNGLASVNTVCEP
jgi:hypothetical protein